MRLDGWYAAAGRDFPWRQWRDPYRSLIVEVLLQRTAARVVADFAPSFFSSFPSWQSLAGARIEDLEETLAPIGLQRRRARSLHAAALVMVTAPPADWEDLPGVGQYIGRAVKVTLHGSAQAMVDTNFLRVLRRVFPPPWRSDYRYDDRLQALSSAIVRGASDPRVANWAVLDLAATVCTSRTPRCSSCPLADACLFAQNGS